ncbi:hypothetical protein GQ600_13829 [Phytophthora cactorum]|nr:hypothetical protein GQ600_13829 [Phytophthora cactorum]
MVKHRFKTNGVPTKVRSVSRSFWNLHCHQQTLNPPFSRVLPTSTATVSDLSISTNFVESANIDKLREMGLLRQDIEPLTEPQSPLTYGVVSDHG